MSCIEEWFVQHENMTERQTGVSVRSIAEWTMRATEYIRFQPDRAAVAEELKASYEDHRDELIEAGETTERASFLALQAMGDPAETSRMLRSVYHPLITFLWRISRVVLIFLLMTATIAVIPWIRNQDWSLMKDPEEALLNTMAFYREMDEDTWIREGHCNETTYLGDYSFTVTRAMICQTVAVDFGGDYYYFMVLVLKVDGPFTLDTPSDLRYYLTAEDDQLNFYDSIWNKINGHTPERFVNLQNIGARRWNSHYACLWIANTEPDVRWIDLSYDHWGKSFVLRVRFDEEDAL